MNKYGQVAVNAAKLCNEKRVTPVSAWQIESEKIFEMNSSSAVKGGPKNTFLGLCEEGLLKGILPGDYAKYDKNKIYATKAVELLTKNPELVDNISELWKMIVGDETIYESQLDVVVALFEADLIKS